VLILGTWQKYILPSVKEKTLGKDPSCQVLLFCQVFFGGTRQKGCLPSA